MAEEDPEEEKGEGEELPPFDAAADKREFRGNWKTYSVSYFPPSVSEKLATVSEEYGYDRWLTLASFLTDIPEMTVEEVAKKVGAFEQDMKYKHGLEAKKKAKGGGE